MVEQKQESPDMQPNVPLKDPSGVPPENSSVTPYDGSPPAGRAKRPLPIAKNMPTKAERGAFRSKRGPWGRR